MELKGETGPARLIEWLGPDLAADALTGFEASLCRSDLPDPWEVSRMVAAGTGTFVGFTLLAGVVERVKTNRTIDDLPRPVLWLAMLHHDFCYQRVDWKEGSRTLLTAITAEPTDAEQWYRLWIEPQLDRHKVEVEGLRELTHDPRFPDIAARLLGEWLERYPAMPQTVVEAMVDGLLGLNDLVGARAASARRRQDILPDNAAALFWTSVDWVSDFDRVQSGFAGIGLRHPNLLFAIAGRIGLDRYRKNPIRLSVAQLEWLLHEFLPAWPPVERRPGSERVSDGDNASEILGRLLNRLSAASGADAEAAFGRFLAARIPAHDAMLRHAAQGQRRRRHEAAFAATSTVDLAALLCDAPPGTIAELHAIVLDVLDDVQGQLRGSNTNTVAMFWNDKVPHGENYCRDRLTDLIRPLLQGYGIQCIPECAMPMGTRADLAFAHRRLQLPMEIKGQWHDAVWRAADKQLAELYLHEWRAERHGVYVVLWFGDLPQGSRQRLRGAPDGFLPGNADAMAKRLIGDMPIGPRSTVAVRVLDLTR